VAFMCNAVFTAVTPYIVVAFVLFAGGWFRSLQLTALGAMAFADVPQDKMSGASSLSSMGQQLAQAFGVALAAVALYAAQRYAESPVLTAADVWPAFVIVGLASLLSLFFYVNLPHDAAAEVSGHRQP